MTRWFTDDGDPYVPGWNDDLTGPEWTEEQYPAWSEKTSRVISGPIGNAKFPGTRHPTWQSAKAYAETKYRVLKFGCIPGRWFARIAKP